MAIFTAILNDGMRVRFESIEGYGTVFQVPTDSEGYRALHGLPEGTLRTQVLDAFSDSFRVSTKQIDAYLQTCWIIGCALLAFPLVVSSTFGRALIPSSHCGRNHIV